MGFFWKQIQRANYDSTCSTALQSRTITRKTNEKLFTSKNTRKSNEKVCTSKFTRKTNEKLFTRKNYQKNSPLFGIIYSYKYKALSFFALLYNSKLHAEKNRQIRDELEKLCRLRRPFSTYVRHIETMRCSFII